MTSVDISQRIPETSESRSSAITNTVIAFSRPNHRPYKIVPRLNTFVSCEAITRRSDQNNNNNKSEKIRRGVSLARQSMFIIRPNISKSQRWDYYNWHSRRWITIVALYLALVPFPLSPHNKALPFVGSSRNRKIGIARKISAQLTAANIPCSNGTHRQRKMLRNNIISTREISS